MKTIRCLILLILLGACKEKYSAPIHIPASGYLVVEGFINVGTGSTNIKLSRAVGLDSIYTLPETQAAVFVESENGMRYTLSNGGKGTYSIDQIPVDFSQKYRIHIVTPDGKEYLSDLSNPKLTPPIDSVSWKAVGDGVWIYVTTHDPQKNTQYYQWQYEETWKYTSAYLSEIEYKNGELVIRPDSDRVHVCWRSDISTAISIASSAKLNADIIFENPLTMIPFSSSNKLIIKYSILVRQFALTKEWYEWLQKIKRNTEQVGSIFDAQPSGIGGNIHCSTNPDEPVIGYVGCSAETHQRIFISREEIPPVPIFSGYEYCQVDTVKYDKDLINTYFGGRFFLPITFLFKNSPSPYAVLGADYSCVDCRASGGTLTKPDFWQ